MAGHSRRIARLCHDMAQKMSLPAADIQTIETAALLHNIGKISLPDRLLETPYLSLPYADRTEFDKHPLRAAAALMALEPLAQVSELIRHHREHYDGVGTAPVCVGMIFRWEPAFCWSPVITMPCRRACSGRTS